ncbi:MAG TPA: APC family permease [Terriglobia bacterium]|nr:APC family permease [Terriglobia bacterium]
MALLDFILGRPLADSEEFQERVGPARAIPIFGLDAISSASYGPEAALTVLMPLGAAGLSLILPITAAIIVLLTIVYFSYRQTIAAYRTGGGSYTVARENLGANAGLLAASALMIDYILNVAVAISAGIGALISARPGLQPYTLNLCLGVLLFLALVNLRGVRESSFVFLIPTWLFVCCLTAVIVVGVTKALGPGQPHAVAGSRPLQVESAVNMWLLLKAFSSGCTALTGVEAVSNGVKAFREPVVKSARRTLTTIVVILIVLLAGIAFLTHAYQITAKPPGEPGYESILSQLTRAVAGDGVFYDLTIASILLVLTFSANTSFADFPRVCRALAADGYLPQSFANRGRRLVYSEGIIVLTIIAAILLWIFGGITDRLIPLFAIGAFVAFTFSQAGMVVHWKRVGGRGSKASLLINGIGALATCITAVIMAVAKFADGAWVSIFLFFLLIRIMLAVRHHYDRVARELAAPAVIDTCSAPECLIVLPIETWDRVTRKALLFAFSLSNDVQVVHVQCGETCGADPETMKTLQNELQKSAERIGCPVPRFVNLYSPYRFVVQPIIEYVLALEREHKDRTIAVVIPQLIEPRWYYYFLHNQRFQLLAAQLLLKGDRRIVTVNVAWYLQET